MDINKDVDTRDVRRDQRIVRIQSLSDAGTTHDDHGRRSNDLMVDQAVFGGCPDPER